MDGVGIAVVVRTLRTPMVVTLSSIASAGTTMTVVVVVIRPVPATAVDRMSQTGSTRRIPTLDGGASIIGGGGTHRRRGQRCKWIGFDCGYLVVGAFLVVAVAAAPPRRTSITILVLRRLLVRTTTTTTTVLLRIRSLTTKTFGIRSKVIVIIIVGRRIILRTGIRGDKPRETSTITIIRFGSITLRSSLQTHHISLSIPIRDDRFSWMIGIRIRDDNRFPWWKCGGRSGVWFCLRRITTLAAMVTTVPFTRGRTQIRPRG